MYFLFATIILGGVFLYGVIFFLSFVPFIDRLVNHHRRKLENINSFLAVFTIIGIISSLAFFYKQEKEQFISRIEETKHQEKLVSIQEDQLQKQMDLLKAQEEDHLRISTLEKQNQQIFINNAKEELKNNLNLTQYILRNDDELRKTRAFPLNEFNYFNLDKLTSFYPDQNVRRIIFLTEVDMKKANRQIELMSSPIYGFFPDGAYLSHRVVIANVLQLITRDIEGNINFLLQKL